MDPNNHETERRDEPRPASYGFEIRRTRKQLPLRDGDQARDEPATDFEIAKAETSTAPRVGDELRDEPRGEPVADLEIVNTGRRLRDESTTGIGCFGI